MNSMVATDCARNSVATTCGTKCQFSLTCGVRSCHVSRRVSRAPWSACEFLVGAARRGREHRCDAPEQGKRSPRRSARTRRLRPYACAGTRAWRRHTYDARTDDGPCPYVPLGTSAGQSGTMTRRPFTPFLYRRPALGAVVRTEADDGNRTGPAQYLHSLWLLATIM